MQESHHRAPNTSLTWKPNTAFSLLAEILPSTTLGTPCTASVSLFCLNETPGTSQPSVLLSHVFEPGSFLQQVAKKQQTVIVGGADSPSVIEAAADGGEVQVIDVFTYPCNTIICSLYFPRAVSHREPRRWNCLRQSFLQREACSRVYLPPSSSSWMLTPACVHR